MGTAKPKARGKQATASKARSTKRKPARRPAATSTRRAAGKAKTKAKAKAKKLVTPAATKKPAATHSALEKKASSSSKNRNAVEAARRNLRSLASLIEQANDNDAEQILGEGRLEALLKAVLPARRRSEKTTYDYLASQKKRASLMAQVRHSINGAYSFATETEGRFLSPTRVQWFYDGLTFVEGPEPFSGVVGLYRNGELSYGLGVEDASASGSLGPSESDFVSVLGAKKSFAKAKKSPSSAESELAELQASEGAAPERWEALMERFPWLLGAQHTGLLRLKGEDPNMPRVFAQRVADGTQDVLLVGQPSASIFGKSARLQRSFQDTLQHAEQTLSFVQRQAVYLQREFRLKVDRPRLFVIAGRGLSRAERETLRHHVDTRHRELRVLTFDDLVHLAQKTRAFFEPRF